MKLVVVHFWLPLLDCIGSANVAHWDCACDNKHSEMVFTVTIAWSFTQLQLIGVMLKTSLLGAINLSFVGLSE